jgi:hypothetical protein
MAGTERAIHFLSPRLHEAFDADAGTESNFKNALIRLDAEYVGNDPHHAPAIRVRHHGPIADPGEHAH